MSTNAIRSVIPEGVLHDLNDPRRKCRETWSGGDHCCDRLRGHFGSCICSCGASR